MALFNWRKSIPSFEGLNDFERFCNERSSADIRGALDQYKNLRKRVREQANDLQHRGRICDEVSCSCTYVSRAAATWRYKEKDSFCPLSHYENYDLGRWEGSNWFYRTHLLNHVIKCLEEYVEKFNVRQS